MDSDILNVAGFANDSIVDGPGVRFTIFVQGCKHNCKGCHNPETHAIGAGKNYTINDIMSMIKSNPLLTGVTFSGGEPFLQAKALARLAREIKKINLDIVTYTGFIYENLLKSKDENIQALLKISDFLVDGQYISALQTLEIPYRGSKNQRFIDLRTGGECYF